MTGRQPIGRQLMQTRYPEIEVFKGISAERLGALLEGSMLVWIAANHL